MLPIVPLYIDHPSIPMDLHSLVEDRSLTLQLNPITDASYLAYTTLIAAIGYCQSATYPILHLALTFSVGTRFSMVSIRLTEVCGQFLPGCFLVCVVAYIHADKNSSDFENC